MIDASALAGFCTAPPYAPECRSTGDSSTSICAYIIPRSPTVIAGTLPSKKPVSLMTTASAARRSPLPAIHASRLCDPYSSSPSKRNVMLTAGARPTARSASIALRCITSWPLSSATPRPMNRPSRTNGSNGGCSHRSSGSTGCTS